MKTIWYKVTTEMDMLESGDVIEAYLVAYDPDQNAGLCLLPPAYEEGSFINSGIYEFVRPIGDTEDTHCWVSAPDIHHINI